MRALMYALLFSTIASTHTPPARASFAHVTVTAPKPTTVRAIWPPYSVSLGPDINERQRRIAARRGITHPDSLQRWRDRTVRDTLELQTPFEFTVDFAAASILLEAVGPDSIQVAIERLPRGGPVAVERGRVFRLPRPSYLGLFGRSP